MKRALKKIDKALLGVGRAICAAFALILLIPFFILADGDDRYYRFED